MHSTRVYNTHAHKCLKIEEWNETKRNNNTQNTHFERDLYNAGEQRDLGEFHIAEDLDFRFQTCPKPVYVQKTSYFYFHKKSLGNWKKNMLR